MLLRALCLALMLVPLGTAGQAGTIPGQDDARFAAALGEWLADDEATSLPALAELAGEGNRAAQVLLAVIDGTSFYQGPWLVHLSRADRIRLMRAPGGMSGRSWMQVAAGDTPLAALWVAWQDPASPIEPALALSAMGERGAAERALAALAARQFREFATSADDPRFPADSRHLIWQEWMLRGSEADQARARAEVLALPPGDTRRRWLANAPMSQADRDAWLATAPRAASLRAICESLCPDGIAACLRGADILATEFIYNENPAVIIGPAEALVPPDVWAHSARGRLALLRHPTARQDGAYMLIGAVTAADSCLGSALSAETARFYQ